MWGSRNRLKLCRLSLAQRSHICRWCWSRAIMGRPLRAASVGCVTCAPTGCSCKRVIATNMATPALRWCNVWMRWHPSGACNGETPFVVVQRCGEAAIHRHWVVSVRRPLNTGITGREPPYAFKFLCLYAHTCWCAQDSTNPHGVNRVFCLFVKSGCNICNSCVTTRLELNVCPWCFCNCL
jgi:hypothetical protein